MKYEDDFFDIEYNSCDEEYISEVIYAIKSNGIEILDFFGLDKVDRKVNYKFWDSIEDFRAYANQKGLIAPWVVGKTIKTKEVSRIDCLSLRERLKAEGHSEDTIEHIIKVVVHEFVHNCHTQYTDYNSSPVWVREGLATYLSSQQWFDGTSLNCSLQDILENKVKSYRNYYLIFKYIFNNYNYDYILKLAKDKKFAESELPRLYEETRNWLN